MAEIIYRPEEAGVVITSPIWLGNGKNVGVSGVGHHLATVADDGHLHLHAHNEFNGQTTQQDAQIVDAYAFTEKMVYQAVNTGTWTGTEQTFTIVSPAHLLINDGYLQTDTVAATKAVRWRIYKGTDDTGYLIFDQKYDPSEFPASTEIKVEATNFMEFEAGLTYFHKISSGANFSLKMNAANTIPWLAADTSFVREDNLLQTKPWVSGDTWTAGDFFIDSRKLYVCNVTGVQTGTFASNSAKWNDIGSESADIWDNTNDHITNVVGSYFTFTDKATSQFRLRMDDAGFYALSPDGSKNMQLTNTDLDLNTNVNLNGLLVAHDGTRNRILTDGTETTLYAPDGDYMKVSNEDFRYHDGTRARLWVSASTSDLASPNGESKFIADNTGAYINSRGFAVLDAMVDGVTLYSPDNDIHIVLSNTSIAMADANRNRVAMNATDSRMVSPDGVFVADVANAGISLGDATRSRVNVNSSDTQILSPNGASLILTHDNWIRSTALTHYIHDRTRDRVRIDTNDSRLLSPDGAKNIIVSDTGIAITGGTYGLATTLAQITTATFNVLDAARTRISANASDTRLVSADGSQTLVVTDTGTTITGGTFDVNDGTRDRINLTNIHAKMLSPDGNLNMAVSNSKVMLTGDTDIVGSAIISDALTVGTAGTTSPAHYTYLILARWTGGHNASTGLQFQGGSTASGFRPDWQMDNFYGNLRMFLNTSESYEIQMQNVGTGDMLLHVDGNIAAIGNEGWSEAGNTAEIMLGDAANFIRATNNNMMLIESPLGIKFSDWTKTDYLMLSAGKIIMAQLPTSDPSGLGELWNSSGTVKVSAG